MNSTHYLFFLVLIGSVLALLGGIVFLFSEYFRNVLTKYSIAFASGVLITISILGLLPEAEHQVGDVAYLATLITFVVVYIFESYFFELHHHSCQHQPYHHHHHHNDLFQQKNNKIIKKPIDSSIIWVVVGDTIHNFIDGAAIAGAFQINPGLGFVMAISTFLHEVPHEVGDFGILLESGFSRKKVILINLFSSLSAFVGAAVVHFWVLDKEILGFLLAIAAGMFLYLGASDFLPKMNQKRENTNVLFAFLLGCLLIYLSMKIIPHSHHHDHTDEHSYTHFSLFSS